MEIWLDKADKVNEFFFVYYPIDLVICNVNVAIACTYYR